MGHYAVRPAEGAVGVSAGQVTYLQPASVRLWKPGWQRSHLSPVTPGLHVHTPLLSHCSDSEPGHTQARARVSLRTEDVPWTHQGGHSPTALQPQGRQRWPSSWRWWFSRQRSQFGPSVLSAQFLQ